MVKSNCLQTALYSQKKETMLPKPKPCGENWLAMQPADGGRICGKCTKLIRDFSGASWAEIERVQRENNYAVCGTYTPAQLKHWGQTPAPRRFRYAAPLVMATTAVSLLPAGWESVHAQPPAVQLTPQPTGEAAAPEPASESPDSGRTVVFSGKVVHAADQQPLPGVNVLLKGSPTGTVTGYQGEFRLELDAAELDSAAVLVFSFIGFAPREVPVSPATPGPFTLQLTADLTGVPNFYVVKPSLPNRVWWKVKRAFAPRRKR
jgi:hypothetical protein